MSEADEIRTTIAEAEIGAQVEAFLETPVGRYINGCVGQEETSALDNLLIIDPYSYTELGALQSAVARAQQEVKIAEKIHSFLADAIIRGNQAEEILENIEES